jgi:hypothetical protein
MKNHVYAACVLGLTVGALACGSGSTSPVAGTSPQAVSLMVQVKVTNTHFGTAVPSDFSVAVSYDGGSPVPVEGTDGGTALALPLSRSYSTTVTGPDGYDSRLSGSCAGVSKNALDTCVVTLTDQPVTCDDALWSPIYHKERLRVLSACEAVVGTLEDTENARDGDLVLYVKPDAAYTRLLKAGNDKAGGRLVVEVPCQGAVVQDDAKGTCDKYEGGLLRVPPIGARLVAAAHWVQDGNHYNWAELHGAKVLTLPR